MTSLRLPPLPSIKDVLKIYKLRAWKQLSQNFILNDNLSNKIVKKAGNLSECHTIEVGPGPGGLTRSILKQYPKKLIVIEKDRRFQPMLEMLTDAYAAVNGEMEIVFNDIMKLNVSNFLPETAKRDWEDKSPKIRIIGNLPFNVSTPLIIKWLHAICERRDAWAFGRTRMTLTFQKEVAERIIAEPNDKQRCRLSVMVQAWTHPVLHFIIPGSAFVPQPKVDVGVVTFAPLTVPRTKHEFKIFEKVTRHIFSFRQKYSIRGIETLFPLEYRTKLGQKMYELSNLDPKLRSTQLSVEDIDKLVTVYKYLLDKYPDIRSYEYRSSRRILRQKEIRNVEITDCTEQDIEQLEHIT